MKGMLKSLMFYGVAMTWLFQPFYAFALAPETFFPKKSSSAPQNRSSDEDPTTKQAVLLRYAEDIRKKTAAKNWGIDRFVLDLSSGKVLGFRAGEGTERVLEPLPQEIQRVMERMGRASIAFPMAGSYEERIVAIFASLTTMSRRSFGAWAWGMLETLRGGHLKTVPMIKLVQRTIFPAAKPAEPLTRFERLSILFRIDMILGERFGNSWLLENKLDNAIPEDPRLPFAARVIGAMDTVIQKGIKRDPEMIRYLKDAVIFSKWPMDKVAVAEAFDRRFPKYALGADHIQYVRHNPLSLEAMDFLSLRDRTSIKRRIPGLWFDLDMLEWIALCPDFQGIANLPSDMKAFLRFRSWHLGAERLEVVKEGPMQGGIFHSKFDPVKFLDSAVRAVGSVSIDEMHQLDSVARLYGEMAERDSSLCRSVRNVPGVRPGCSIA